jgi:hypothetical protein
MVQAVVHLIILSLLPWTIDTNFQCVKDGFFPDKRDCWIYHICVGNSHSVKACKDDLLFNPGKNECDWPMNVAETSNVSSLCVALFDVRFTGQLYANTTGRYIAVEPWPNGER